LLSCPGSFHSSRGRSSKLQGHVIAADPGHTLILCKEKRKCFALPGVNLIGSWAGDSPCSNTVACQAAGRVVLVLNAWNWGLPSLATGTIKVTLLLNGPDPE
jgi:hypothetical protein